MTRASQSVLEAALALNDEERAEVAEQLLYGLGEGRKEEIDAAWAAEAERRDRAVDDGTEDLLPGEPMIEQMLRGECP